jgi:hypothetical protein
MHKAIVLAAEWLHLASLCSAKVRFEVVWVQLQYSTATIYRLSKITPI